MGENQHHLEVYLTSILPQIGLDAETYAPYITGILPDADTEPQNPDCDEELEEELEGIIQLLQASSESHGDDDQTWVDLKAAIKEKDAAHRSELRLVRERASERRKEEIESGTRTDLELARGAQEERRAAEEREVRERRDMDPAKRALLEQYAYVESEVYDNDGNLIVSPATDDGEGGGGASSQSNGKAASASGGGASSGKTAGKATVETDTSNRAMAQKYQKEVTRQSRTTEGQTKKEERSKTKNAKLDKIKQKEERRKRATKGERKR